MRRKRSAIAIGLIGLFAVGGLVVAQRNRAGRNSIRAPISLMGPEKVSDGYGRAGVPVWETDKDFPNDHFTFVRLRYSGGGGGGRGRGGGGWGGGRWTTDIPSSEMNFSFRLQQLTSLKVNPEPIILDITDPELLNHPFCYMLEVGGLVFSEEEIECLRRYCFNGGFLMVDDFWGENQWQWFEAQIRRVFPDRDIVDLPLDHQIFHIVYDLKQKPQVPGIQAAAPGSDISYESWDSREVHYRAIFDDAGRMMVIICQNTDLGDGWEREGEAEWYFKQFSEKWAYPMGINIVFYAMTH